MANTTYKELADYVFNPDEYDVEKCLYLDLKNNNTKEIDYSFCGYGSTQNETYITKRTNNKTAIYNSDLERISTNEYDYIFDLENFLIVRKDDVYIIIDPKENKLVEQEFEDFDSLSDGGYKLKDKDKKIYYFSYE